MRTITICNQKGGVGKTTTASALAAGLRRRGFRVVAIDSDPQGNLTASTGLNPDEEDLTLDSLYSSTASFESVVRRDTSIGDLIPCSLSLSDADRRFTQYKAYRMLKNILEPIEGQYDYCIIDAPPSLGILSVNDLIATDSVIVPVNAAAFSIQGISALVKIVAEAREDNPGIKIEGILLTRFNSRTNLSKDVLEALNVISEQIGTRVFKTTIRQGVAIEAAQADHLDIFTAAPKSGVAKDYSNFIEEFLQGGER